MVIVQSGLDLAVKIASLIASVFSAVISFHLIRQVNTHKKQSNSKGNQQEEHIRRLSRFGRFFIVAFLIFLIFPVSLTWYQNHLETQSQAGNTALTSEAWDAFNAKKYDKAIGKAEECIALFKADAKNIQAGLLADDVPLPPTGSVGNAQYQEIIDRGPLNDVGTCYYIIGWSQECLGHVDEAKEAYREAIGYSYARCWDSKGWFWSPSEKASGRLVNLR